MYLGTKFNYPSKILSLATKVVVNQIVFTPVFNSYFFGMQSRTLCSLLNFFPYPNLILSLETCLGSFYSSDMSRSSLIILEREVLTLKSLSALR